jgi:hypothetical protein
VYDIRDVPGVVNTQLSRTSWENRPQDFQNSKEEKLKLKVAVGGGRYVCHPTPTDTRPLNLITHPLYKINPLYHIHCTFKTYPM